MPRFENSLSLGNLLIAAQLGAMLIGLGVLYATTAARIEAAADDRASMKAITADQEARIRILERDMMERLIRIETLIRQGQEPTP